ncbi:GNAT family N-acetyltransferase [Vibrio sp. 03-59-1]|uniref:GNAT family N-acetyltransferase n=1 Tax=Vibrio sp. 03-59-1 TaxID=2607607 RepID=UPI00149360B1|nr:GNAT family N-acetyltransferase [Vibrio sp. 03-59-1]
MESNRIKLVPPSMELAPQMLAAIQESQEELSVFLPWVPYALTTEDSVKNTQDAIVNFEQFEGELRFSIIDKESDILVGAIGLIIRDKTVPYFEIGYWLRTAYVGKGFITEAVKLIEVYAFSELKANRVEIRAADINYKSRSVAERCGYILEGIFMSDRLLPSGELSNTAVYGKTGF